MKCIILSFFVLGIGSGCVLPSDSFEPTSDSGATRGDAGAPEFEFKKISTTPASSESKAPPGAESIPKPSGNAVQSCGLQAAECEWCAAECWGEGQCFAHGVTVAPDWYEWACVMPDYPGACCK